MKHFKKRTVALVLASVVTVVGAFGAENYKNSLMSLKFESKGSGAVNMTVLTKRDYAGTITPVKKDASTYIIMLPETNSEMASPANIEGDIESVDIRTMPYTKTSRGYTKITVKTVPNTMVNAQKAIYVPEKKQEALPAPQPAQQTQQTQSPQVQFPMPEELPQQQSPPQPVQQVRPAQTQNNYQSVPPETAYHSRPDTIHSRSGVSQTEPVDIKESVKQFEPSDTNIQQVRTEIPAQSSSSTELVIIILGVILAIAVSVYFILRARDKMAELTGEQSNFDLSDDEPKKKKDNKTKKQKIRSTIKNLDKMYTKPVRMPVDKLNTAADTASSITANTTAPTEDDTGDENNIVDLDELFQEKNREQNGEITEDDESDALEDFLKSFSFQEEEPPEDEEIYDEQLYEKYINDGNLRFSNDDIERINKLLNSEISDDTMKNLQNFVVSNPIEKKPSRKEILENFVTAYTINQNISFTKDDVDALYKLISVEIDPDFITDLRCNPERMEAMQREMEKQKTKPHKTSELLTLNVKDMLPDLSEALRKQGGKRIESEAKPQVVYFSEGYDVSTLKLDEALPDLSKEINNADAYKTRPSDSIQYVASGYDVEKMSVTDELPDLRDVLLHPEKYETPEEEPVKVDEEALLNNLSNVTFKPFEEGYQAPSVSDMQEEFNQFGGGFEIVDEEDIPVAEENDNDDFASLYDNNYVDLDKEENHSQIDDAQKLLELIEQKRVERQSNPQEHLQQESKPVEPKADRKKNLKQEPKLAEQQIKPRENLQQKPKSSQEEANLRKINKNCAVEGEIYTIVSVTNFNGTMGCYLAKNEDKYCVLGFVGNKTFKVKYYDKLKSEKLESRVSDKLEDGTLRYIVRLANHKFIMKVNGENMEYVMDLC